MVYRHDKQGRTLEEFVNHLPTALDLRIFPVLYQHPKQVVYQHKP